MIGITSFGAYIPRQRLSRMAAFQAMGWFAPAIALIAQGERSFCNWDEDSVTMAVEASRDCLAGMDKSRPDGLMLASTTLPFADRQNAGIVAAALNLGPEILTVDVTASQRAGTTALITALEAVRGGEKKQILVTASDKRETRAAYFYELWFGDGAASVMVGDTDVIAEFRGSYSVSRDFVDHYRGAWNSYDYVWEERWVRDAGYSQIIPEAVNGLMTKLGITMEDVDKLAFPCFFQAEHRKIAQALGASPEKLVGNLHEVCGETGAAHSLMLLISALETARPGDRILAAGFGQGCDALYLVVTEHILRMKKRNGVAGSLANRKPTDNYLRFLKFRDLIRTEMGIRAEAPTQTAMTTLYRKNAMLLGLVGGKCRECKTPQFPKMDICVNPSCRAIHSQDDYGFSDIPATIKTFTGDLLAVSVDPPAAYGMIQFEGGGRFMADFTDSELGELRVGLPMRMMFRKRSEDKNRGFVNYFWKAAPVPGAAARMDQVSFSGRVAVVTGAGAGLGRAYAVELAARGAKVVVNDLGGARDGSGPGSMSAADAVVEEIRNSGGVAVANYDNVATPEGGQAIIDTAIREFGRVDILINNAGILRDKTLMNMEPENWRAVMDVHLNGAYHVTRPAFSRMKEQGFGRIIFTTSAAGLYGNFGQTNYSAAKMGLVGLMNTLKLEGMKYDVKVNTVAPLAASRLTEDVMPPELLERSRPEFVVPMVLYLCSDVCDVTGRVYNAGMGYYSRAAVVTGTGVRLGTDDVPPTPEEVLEAWEKIESLEGGKEAGSLVEALIEMQNAAPPTPALHQAGREKKEKA